MSRFVNILSLEGGQNSADPPTTIADNQCVAARNVDWYRATGARKRGGSTAISLTSGPSSAVAYMFRHVPGSDETAAELWAFDNGGPIGIWRYSSGAWATPGGTNPFGAGDGVRLQAATLNGKMFVAGGPSTGASRLCVWDGTTFRRAGLETPAAATVANTGAGAYAATARWYWVIWTVQSGGITTYRSPESAVVTFTPSGGGTAARVTRPTAPTVDTRVTHWELYGSATSSFGAAVLLGTTVLATTTFDDSTAPASYTGAAPPVVGTNTVQKPYKFIIADGNRLLGLGDLTTGGKQSRVEYTVVLGTADIGDDERVPQTANQKNYINLDENDGGGGTALAGPLFGAIYAFKYRQTWKLKPTGIDTKPYDKIALTKKLGCIQQRSIVDAEDKDGNPALYWLSHRGPMRAGINGLERLWRPIKDTWETVNLGATNVVGHGVFHTDKNQIWWYVATGSSNSPDTKIVYDVEKEAFSIHDGISADAMCSVMFANTLGASVSRDLKPHIARTASAQILKCDTADLDDNGTAFQAYVTLKPVTAAGLGFNTALLNVYVLAKAASAVTLTATLTRDFGLETKTATADLTPDASETRVAVTLDDGQLAGCRHIAVTIGDASALAKAWTIDTLAMELTQQEPV